MQKITHFIYIVLLIITPTCIHAQDGWSQFGPDSSIISEQPDAIGNLIADNNGNFYTTISNYDSHTFYVAKYDGTSWAELGTGVNALNANRRITMLACDKANNVYAAGTFTNANGKYYVAKWNGTSWTELDPNSLNANASQYQYINSLALDTAGNIYVTGVFVNDSGKYYVAKWDGTTWTEVGTGGNALNLKKYIKELKSDNFGNLYAVDFLNADSIRCSAKWNGTTWTQLGAGAAYPVINGTMSVEVDNLGNLYVGENYGYPNGFTPVGGYVYKWNGTSWSKLGNDTNYLYSRGGVLALAKDNSGNIYASKYLDTNVTITTIYKWDGVSWKQAGNESIGLNASGEIHFILNNNGTLYTGGSIKNDKGKNYIAKYTPINYITYTFTGNGAWENPANWSTGKIPDMNTDVIIAIGKTVTINSNQTIRSIKIDTSATVTVSTGYVLTVLH